MIYDISQEITKCKVYPGDPSPKVETINSFEKDDVYNLSLFSMCAHNGTHVDAPSHFIKDGKTIDQIPIDYFVGECYVYSHKGLVTRDDAIKIIKVSRENSVYERILIKGDCVVAKEAAEVFANSNIKLLGNESQSVGPIDSPMEVHLILLRNNIVLLEGICLKNINDGKYFLCAQPLNIKGIEGSPCRAILIK